MTITNASVQSIFDRMKAEQDARAANAENARPKILAYMLEHNIPVIKVEFSGSGDDGCINGINIVPTIDTDFWDGTPLENSHPEFNKLVEDYADDMLASCGVDWYNNEGGQGHIHFDAVSIPPVFDMVVEYNTMATEVGYSVNEVL